MMLTENYNNGKIESTKKEQNRSSIKKKEAELAISIEETLQ